MKKVFTVFIITLTLAASVYAQDHKQGLYEQKVQGYAKMKKTGHILTGIGGGMTIAGIILVSSADWTTESTYNGTNFNTNDPAGIAGTLILVGGAGLTVTGIVLSSVGSRKYKEYKQKLNNISITPIHYNKNYGVTLTYRF